jgi:hypothetical protein
LRIGLVNVEIVGVGKGNIINIGVKSRNIVSCATKGRSNVNRANQTLSYTLWGGTAGFGVVIFKGVVIGNRTKNASIVIIPILIGGTIGK